MIVSHSIVTPSEAIQSHILVNIKAFVNPSLFWKLSSDGRHNTYLPKLRKAKQTERDAKQCSHSDHG